MIWPFSSVLYQGNGSYSSNGSTVVNDQFTLGAGGNVTTSNSDTRAGTYGPSGIAVGGTSGGDGGYVYSYNGNSLTTNTFSSSSSYTNFQAGQWANGSYNLSSVVLRETGQSNSTINVGMNQTFGMTRVGTDSDSSQSTLTAGSGVGLYDIRGLQLDGTYDYDANETYTSTSHGAGSYSNYRAGTLKSWSDQGGNQAQIASENYSSVVYQWGDSGDYSESDIVSQTWAGDGTGTATASGTETSGALTGSTRTSDTAPFSYSLSALGTYTGNGTWSSSDSRAGQYANGSASYGTAVHDEHSEYSGDYVRVADFGRHATGTWVNVRSGISTSGVNGTYLYTADGSATYVNAWDSTNSSTSHQEGSYANNSFSVASLVYDGVSSFSSDYTYYGSDTATNTTGFEIDGSFTGSGGQTGSWSLHKEGAGSGSAEVMTPTGSNWNLSCYVERSNALGSETSERDETQSDGTYDSTSTYTASAIGTYSLYRSGGYSNSSFSFGSVNISEQVTGQDRYQETGTNASYTSYTRDDSSSYSYTFTETTGGNYSQSSLQTITRNFDGDQSGGGSVHNSSVVTYGYSNSGTRGQGSGAVMLPDGGGMRTSERAMDGNAKAGAGFVQNLPYIGGQFQTDFLPNSGGQYHISLQDSLADRNDLANSGGDFFTSYRSETGASGPISGLVDRGNGIQFSDLVYRGEPTNIQLIDFRDSDGKTVNRTKHITEVPTNHGTVFLYYGKGAKRVFIGIYDPKTGLVYRDGWQAKIQYVVDEANSTWTTSDWAQWFHGMGNKMDSNATDDMRRLDVQDRPDGTTDGSLRNDSADRSLTERRREETKIIRFFAKVGIYWLASGAMFVSPSGNIYLWTKGKWVNARSGAQASEAEAAAANRMMRMSPGRPPPSDAARKQLDALMQALRKANEKLANASSQQEMDAAVALIEQIEAQITAIIRDWNPY